MVCIVTRRLMEAFGVTWKNLRHPPHPLKKSHISKQNMSNQLFQLWVSEVAKFELAECNLQKKCTFFFRCAKWDAYCNALFLLLLPSRFPVFEVKSCNANAFVENSKKRFPFVCWTLLSSQKGLACKRKTLKAFCFPPLAVWQISFGFCFCSCLLRCWKKK